MVLGLREVAKNLKMSKVKAVIVSPNVEKIHYKGNFWSTLCIKKRTTLALCIVSTCTLHKLILIIVGEQHQNSFW